MKRIATATVLIAALSAFTGCNDEGERTLYNGPEYIMFSDTLSECYVTPREIFAVDVASTVACDYDRTFGVKVVAKGSNAVEGRHFELVSDNITIKAGERSAKVELRGFFDKIDNTDSLGTILQLVIPENTQWPLYNTETKVTFRKHCDFNMETWFENEKRAEDPEKYDYANYIFYATFPYASAPGQVTKILVKVRKDPKDDHKLIVKGPFQENLDMVLRLVEGEPGEEYVTMVPQKCFFTSDYGNVTLTTTDLYPSEYNTCLRYIDLTLNAYIESLGSFGVYEYALEWISEYEAEDIRNNGF